MSRAVIRTRLRQQLNVPTTRTRSNVASSIARAMASPRCTTWMAASTSWTLLNELLEEERLLCRAQVPLHLKPEHSLDKLDEAEEMRRRYNSDMLWSGRVKMFMDGVHDSRTAFTLRGYPEEPGNTGAPLFSQDHFTQAAIACDARGLQIAVHAIGDAAVRRTLDGYEAARRVNGAARQPSPGRAYRGVDAARPAEVCRAWRDCVHATAALTAQWLLQGVA
jgi:predicted amidohydrolase YtcJ